MHIQAERGALCVVLSRRLGTSDVERIHEAISALGPFSSVTLDFSSVGESDATELARVATLLRSLPPGNFTLRGLSMRQSHMLLKRLSEAPDRVAA
jgi:hypothetical protein